MNLVSVLNLLSVACLVRKGPLGGPQASTPDSPEHVLPTQMTRPKLPHEPPPPVSRTSHVFFFFTREFKSDRFLRVEARSFEGGFEIGSK